MNQVQARLSAHPASAYAEKNGNIYPIVEFLGKDKVALNVGSQPDHLPIVADFSLNEVQLIVLVHEDSTGTVLLKYPSVEEIRSKINTMPDEDISGGLLLDFSRRLWYLKKLFLNKPSTMFIIELPDGNFIYASIPELKHLL